VAREPGRSIDYLRKVVCEDSLGIGAELEADMQNLVDTYECEWKKAINDPEIMKRFRHFVNSDEPDRNVVFVTERGQIRPARPGEREKELEPGHERDAVRVCRLEDIVPNTGVCALVRGRQVAIFRLDDDSVYALDNRDPSRSGTCSRAASSAISRASCYVHRPSYKQQLQPRFGPLRRGCGGPDTGLPCQVADGFVFVEIAEVPTTCCYCGIGCGVLASVSGEHHHFGERRPGPPRQLRRLCTKGLSLHRPILRFGDCSRRYTAKEDLGRDPGLCSASGRPSRSTVPTRWGSTFRPVPHRGLLRLQQLAKG